MHIPKYSVANPSVSLFPTTQSWILQDPHVCERVYSKCEQGAVKNIISIEHQKGFSQDITKERK